MIDEDSPESDNILFREDTILEGSVNDGLILTAAPDPEGEWFTIGWHERRSVGYWVGQEGDRSIDLSIDSAEKLLPTLVNFVRNHKNATTMYWTGAIAINPRVAEHGHVSSELDERGIVILRTEHHALYINRDELDDAIAVLIAAKARIAGPAS